MLREVRIRRAGPRGFRAAWFVGRLSASFIPCKRKSGRPSLPQHLPRCLVLRDFREAKIRIFTNHSDAFSETRKRRKRRWYHWLTSGASGIIAPSEEIAEKSRDFFRGNGQRLSTSQWRRYESLHTGTAHKFRCCPARRTTWGRYHSPRRPSPRPKCGLDYLIRAMPAVLASEPELFFA